MIDAEKFLRNHPPVVITEAPPTRFSSRRLMESESTSHGVTDHAERTDSHGQGHAAEYEDHRSHSPVPGNSTVNDRSDTALRTGDGTRDRADGGTLSESVGMTSEACVGAAGETITHSAIQTTVQMAARKSIQTDIQVTCGAIAERATQSHTEPDDTSTDLPVEHQGGFGHAGTDSFDGNRHHPRGSAGSRYGRANRRHAAYRKRSPLPGGFASAGRTSGKAIELDHPDDVDACRESALNLLDAAPRSSGTLRQRLLAKGYEEQTVEDVIELLTRVRLLDDRAYAESVIRYCAHRMMGRQGTIMELTRKGIGRSLAQETCAVADEQGVFIESAWELGRSVERKTRDLEPAVRRRRFWNAGGRKGHNPGTLSEIAHTLFDESPY